MLSLLTRSTRMLIRKSRKLAPDESIISQSTSTATSSSPFPFHFGGLDQTPSNDHAIENLAVHDCTKYMQLYRHLLMSIEEQNRNELSKMVDPRLIDPLCSTRVEQIESNSPISLEYVGTMMGLGVTFGQTDIEKPPLPAASKATSNVKLTMTKNLMSQPTKMNKMMTQGLPILISYRIVFKSGHKLVPKGNPKVAGEEKHVLLLQQEVIKSFEEFGELIKGGMNPSNFANFRKMILEANLPWKIGNIDNFLEDPFDS